MNPENPHFEWILWTKSKSGLLRFMIGAFFLGGGEGGGGEDPKKGTSDKRSSMQIYLSRHIFARSCVAKPLHNWKVLFRSAGLKATTSR